jgi:hypothetical protein
VVRAVGNVLYLHPGAQVHVKPKPILVGACFLGDQHHIVEQEAPARFRFLVCWNIPVADINSTVLISFSSFIIIFKKKKNSCITATKTS